MEKWGDAMQNFSYNKSGKHSLKAVRIFFFNEYKVTQNTILRL